jgi:hypothetical protein
MAGPIRQKLPAPLAALARRLDAYRNKPRRQRRLPEKLWAAAARLALEHGVCRVQQALRLSFPDLKRRVRALSRPAAKSTCPAFVELQVPPFAAGAGAVVLELEDGRGRKLTLRLAREDQARLAAAVLALWSAGS